MKFLHPTGQAFLALIFMSVILCWTGADQQADEIKTAQVMRDINRQQADAQRRQRHQQDRHLQLADLDAQARQMVGYDAIAEHAK